MMSQREFVVASRDGPLSSLFRRVFNARYSEDRSVGSAVTGFSRHISVIEGNGRSRQIKEESGLSQFRLADWIVPPVIVPLFLLLLVLAVALLHG